MSTKAINPNAASIRAALKSAGLEDAIRKIVTGTKVAYLYVADDPMVTTAVVKALSPLWNDSKQRIYAPNYGDIVTVAGKALSAARVEIYRGDWEATSPVEFDQERRARALFGPIRDTESHPLQYLPRRKGDREPWAANEHTGIRYKDSEVEEWQPVRDPEVARDIAELEDKLYVPPALSVNQYMDTVIAATKAGGTVLPTVASVLDEDRERRFRTKPGTHAVGRLVARSKCRRNRRR